MIAKIKQPTKKNAPTTSPDPKVQGVRFTTSSRKIYSTLFFLLIVAATILFSMEYNQPFLKELVASGFILCYVLAMQLNEQRMVNNRHKRQNLN